MWRLGTIGIALVLLAGLAGCATDPAGFGNGPRSGGMSAGGASTAAGGMGGGGGSAGY